MEKVEHIYYASDSRGKRRSTKHLMSEINNCRKSQGIARPWVLSVGYRLGLGVSASAMAQVGSFWLVHFCSSSSSSYVLDYGVWKGNVANLEITRHEQSGLSITRAFLVVMLLAEERSDYPTNIGDCVGKRGWGHHETAFVLVRPHSA